MRINLPLSQMLRFILTTILALTSTAQLYDCSLDGLQRSVLEHANRVAEQFSAPARELEDLAAKLVRGEHTLFANLPPSSDAPELDTMARHVNATALPADPQDVWIDRSPDRIMDTYFSGWADTEWYNWTRCHEYYLDPTIDPWYWTAGKAAGCTVPYDNCTVSCLRPETCWPWCRNDTTVQQRYGQSAVRFYYEFSKLLVSEFHTLYEQYRGNVDGWYICDTVTGVRKMPTLPGKQDVSQFFGSDSLFYITMMVHPMENPNRLTRWTPRYYDSTSGLSMLTAEHPIIADESPTGFRGAVLCDLPLSGNSTILKTISNFHPTSRAVSFVMERMSGSIIAADQVAHNLIFCPDLLQPRCHGDVFEIINVDPESLGLSPDGVKESRRGFASIFRDIGEESGILHRVLIGTESYYVLWRDLGIKGSDYVLIVAVPSLDIDASAVWQALPSVTLEGATEYTELLINNTGLLPIEWKANTPNSLTLTPRNGVLISGQSIRITISATPGATELISFTTMEGSNYGHCINTPLEVRVTYIPEYRIGDSVALQLSFGVAIPIIYIIGATSFTLALILLEHRILGNLRIVLALMTLGGIWSASLIGVGSLTVPNMSWIRGMSDLPCRSDLLFSGITIVLVCSALTCWCGSKLWRRRNRYWIDDDHRVSFDRMEKLAIFGTGVFMSLTMTLSQVMTVTSIAFPGTRLVSGIVGIIIVYVISVIVCTISIGWFVYYQDHRQRFFAPLVMAGMLLAVIMTENSQLDYVYTMKRNESTTMGGSTLFIIGLVSATAIFLSVIIIALRNNRDFLSGKVERMQSRIHNLRENIAQSQSWLLEKCKDNVMAQWQLEILKAGPCLRKHLTPQRLWLKILEHNRMDHLLPSDPTSIRLLDADTSNEKWYDIFVEMVSNPVTYSALQGPFQATHTEEMLAFYQEIISYKQLNSKEERLSAAQQILSNYLNEGAPYQINISGAMRLATMSRLSDASPDLFRDVELEVWRLIRENKTLNGIFAPAMVEGKIPVSLYTGLYRPYLAKCRIDITKGLQLPPHLTITPEPTETSDDVSVSEHLDISVNKILPENDTKE